MNKAFKIFITMSVTLTIFHEVSAIEETSDEIEMRMFGGYVKKQNSSKGKIVILNAQKEIDSSELKQCISIIKQDIKPEILWHDVKEISLPNPLSSIKNANGNIGVVIINNVNYPSLLTAPEEGWSIINVASLAIDKPNSKKLASRVRKEILRGFALAAGCSFMARGPFVLRPNVRRPRDLDFIKEECYGIDAIRTLSYSMRYYGIVPWIVTTYENACSLGWAPAPTNEYQKAIWDKVHAAPENPMKIEFDPKKGR